MRNIKLTIAYDGSAYVGWQVQPNGVSVQEKLEAAWEEIAREKIRITASGRTDSGVHARGQVCNLKTETEFSIERIPFALTSQTPFDISVLKAELAPPEFDVIRDATSKTYRYQIQFGPILDVLSRRYRWHVPRPLDPVRMQVAADLLKGTHNFESFQAKGSLRVTTERTVTQLDVIHFRESYYDYIDIVISADGFLYNMVRNIVGSLVRIGVGREQPEWILAVLDKRDRSAAGETAPAQGLFLEKVEYDI
jgi:tRNA pseudouridine38-40 synthase